MITFIIPLYNTAEHILECLRSVQAQTVRDFECIVVNDGSTDEGGKLADEFALTDNRFRIIHQPNNGVSSARNCGIDNSRGDFITFIDSDDFIGPDYLANLLKAQSDDCDLIVSTHIRWKDGQLFDKQISDSCSLDFKNLDSRLYVKQVHMLHGPVCKLYRADIINRHSIRFNTNMRLGEDLCFNLDYLNNARIVTFIPDTDYFYRWSETSLTNRKKYPLDELYAAVSAHKQFMQRHDIWDHAGQAYLYRQLGGYLYDALFNPGNTYSDIRKHVHLIKHDDLCGCIEHFNFPKWMQMSLRYRLSLPFWLRKR